MIRIVAIVFAVLSACGRTALYEPGTFPDAGIDGGVDAGTDAGNPCDVPPGCVEVAASLEGQRWELPCVAPWPPAPDYVCVSTADQTTSATLNGRAGTTYEVTLHVRGVVETKEYPGGIGAPLSRGGTPVDDAWNIYQLDISSPAQRWYLNRGTSGLYECFVIDELLVVRADGRARFTLFASTVDGNRSQIRNRDADGGALLVPGLGSMPFDGQFLQLDVVSVRAAP